MSEIIDNWNPQDKLDRKVSADFLTNFLIKRYALSYKHGNTDTFVLNIRADWGFGKTFFLEHWEKDLKQKKFPVVSFNAWENDFCDDPLIGFIAEINHGLSGHFKQIPLAQQHLDHAIAVGRKLVKPVSLGAASMITKLLSGYSIDRLQELYSQSDENNNVDSKPENEVSTLISKCADVALKEHLDTKTTIDLFKEKLGRLIKVLEAEANIQLPLFIFIDELDRCRPNYAIELLEAVKHLFGVPGIYFVIATNLEQLGHSICAVYGEKFDSEHYLKRFFDHEYLLPFPDSARFTEFLFARYSLNEFGNLYSVIEEGIYEQSSEQALFSIICDSFKLGLRDREQIVKTLQAILLNWNENERIHFAYLLLLIIAKHKSLSLFHQLAENQLMDIKQFREAVKLRVSSFFKTFSITGNESVVGIKEIGVIDLLYSYHHYQAQTCKKLYEGNIYNDRFPDKIKNEIIKDCPNTWVSGAEPVPKVSDYARRVSQSGQLSVSE